MSLTALDNFTNPIVAGRAGGCLETLVPIVGVPAGDQHQDAPSREALPRRYVAFGDPGTRQAVSFPEAYASK